MTAYSTSVRALHLVTNAAWFGGSLLGAVGLNPAAREGDTAKERSQIADAGWTKWGPVQGAAMGLHLLSGMAILADNRQRTVSHRPTTVAVVLKTTLTGAALAASGAAYFYGAKLGEAGEQADENPVARRQARELAQRMRWLQWATPLTTGGILVLDAYLGEQQRGVAGLLDRPELDAVAQVNARFEFAFAPAYRLPALVFGIRPRTAHVTVTDDELRVRFGPWRLVTERSNVLGAEITEDFRWLKTAGPPHLSFSDRGVTFATNGERALCVQFLEPVAGIDPTRTIRHPGATLTVAQPELLHQALL